MRIRAYATMRDMLGTSKIEMVIGEPTPIRQVLKDLAGGCPEFGRKLWDGEGKLTGYITVFVNGRAVEYLDGLDTRVENDDTISLFPPVGGG